MRAVVQTGYGDPQQVLTFSISHPPPPPPSARHVQVRVHAASNSPHDCKVLRGNLKLFVPIGFPTVPGCELSGVVTAVGSAVRRLKVGDAVIAWNKDGSGAYGELVNVPEEFASLKPNNLTFAESAVLPLAAQSALGGLERAALVRGEKVVVIGAAGGVGSYAVCIAKLLGASDVVAVTSAKNADYVKSLGADSIVDYRSQQLSEAVSRDCDVVLDCVGGREQWEEAQKVLKVSGRFVTIVGDDKSHKATVMFVVRAISGLLYRKLAALFTSAHTYHHYLIFPSWQLQDRIVQWAQEGKLQRVRIDRRFEFSEQGAKDMYAHVESGRTVGKVVMEMVKEDGEQRALS